MFDIKDILSTLVSYDSSYQKERSILEWLACYLEKNGFNVRRLKIDNDRFNIYAWRGNEESKLLWYGHVDTVPVYHDWKTDPFKLVEKNDRYYGLGACDMKGGIAALLHAVSELKSDTPVRLLFCADEEYDSEGAWIVYKNHQAIFKNIEYVISMEPGASATKVGGSDVLTLGRRGRVRLLVKVKGISAHGGHPERGINSIDVANGLIANILDQKLTVHDKLGKATHYIARIDGRSVGLSLPEDCEFEIDRHLVIPDTVETALAEYKLLAQSYLKDLRISKGDLAKHIKITVAVKKRKNEYMLPFVTENDVFTNKIQKIIKDNQNNVVINYGRSVGDENIFAMINEIKPIILGPEGGDIHSSNEWVSIKSLKDISEIYSDIARMFAKS